MLQLFTPFTLLLVSPRGLLAPALGRGRTPYAVAGKTIGGARRKRLIDSLLFPLHVPGVVRGSGNIDSEVFREAKHIRQKNHDQIASWSSFESRLQRVILQKPLSDIIRKSVSDEDVLRCRSKPPLGSRMQEKLKAGPPGELC